MLSQSIEHLRNPTAHLEEDEETRGLELTLPPAGVIRSHSSSGSIHLESSGHSEAPNALASVIRVKEEPLDPDSRMDEGGRGRGIPVRRDERKERGGEPMTEVKSEHNVECMTETDVWEEEEEKKKGQESVREKGGKKRMITMQCFREETNEESEKEEAECTVWVQESKSTFSLLVTNSTVYLFTHITSFRSFFILSSNVLTWREVRSLPMTLFSSLIIKNSFAI